MTAMQLYDIQDISLCIQRVMAAPQLAHACPERLNDLKLCLYELLGNALLHTTGRVILTCRFEADSVRISVRQTGAWQGEAIDGCAHCLEAGLTDENGRGLYLVRCLSDEFQYLKGSQDMRIRIQLV